MATLKELTYMVLDELKLSSDDSYFNEEHIAFLIGKYRGFMLRQQYKDVKKEIPDSNFQTITLNVMEVPAISGIPCEGGTFFKTEEKIPFLMTIANPKIYLNNFYEENITYVSRERMKHVGHNKWIPNFMYASIGPDDYMYFISSKNISSENIKVIGIFENPELVIELNDEDSNTVNYPLEEGLIPQVLELVVKELSASRFYPEDKQNDSNDNLSEITQRKNG